MEVFEIGIGQPVASLQTFLRKISEYYNEIPPVIPDGIYGTQTQDSVISFQTIFLLEPTGEVDNDTWNKIIEIYNYIIKATSEPKCIKVYPSADFIIKANDQSLHLNVLQAMLLNLSYLFENISPLQITGIHDEQSVNAFKDFQIIVGLEPTGIIDRFLWDFLADAYETFITRDRMNILI